MDNKTISRINNTLAIRPTKDDCTELFEFTLLQGSTYFALANRKFHDSKIKRIGFIDTKTDYGNLFTIYSSGIYKSVDLIFILVAHDEFRSISTKKITRSFVSLN